MTDRTVGSGGDQVDLDDWNAWAQTVDPFSAKHRALIVAGGISVATQQDITGFDENGFGWEIAANTNASFREHASAATNPLIYDSTKGAFVDLTATSDSTIAVSVTNGTIKDLQLRKSSGYGYVIDTTDSANTLNVENCILNHSSAAKGIKLRKGNLLRSLVVTDGGNGIEVSSGSGTVDKTTCRNIGAAGSTVGLARDHGTWTITNFAVAGYNTDASGTLSGNNNATDSAAGGLPATARQNSLVAATEWEGATTDFRVKSTSAKLKDNGTGASVDIIGQAVATTADIGAWELQGAAAGARPRLVEGRLVNSGLVLGGLAA